VPRVARVRADTFSFRNETQAAATPHPTGVTGRPGHRWRAHDRLSTARQRPTVRGAASLVRTIGCVITHNSEPWLGLDLRRHIFQL